MSGQCIIRKASAFFYEPQVRFTGFNGRRLASLSQGTGSSAVNVSYTYDSWGKIISVSDTSGRNIGTKNPFRYRGYYYDEESGLYYLGSRYYDPEIGRFISADTTNILGIHGNLYDKNLYAYCDNNPIIRIDLNGAVWETVFDVISLCASIQDVVENPDDPWAWAGLVGDALDLIPVVTGVGEIVRAAKIVNKVDNAIAIVKTVDKAEDAVDVVKVVNKTGNGTKKVVNVITGYTKHGLSRAIDRNGVGVKPSAILDTIRNPKKIIHGINEWDEPYIKYKGTQADVVLNEDGKIVTCWAKSSKYWRK